MNPANDAPLWLALVMGIGPVLIFCVLIAVAFVCFVQWVNRRTAADRFADEFLPENADIAAIEQSRPDVRASMLARKAMR